jgi:hypothetical protein
MNGPAAPRGRSFLSDRTYKIDGLWTYTALAG